jgi:membrane-bound lytic murein transglycosylase B
MLHGPLCALYSIRCAGSMDKRPLCSCGYGVEDEFGRILSPLTVVYALAPLVYRHPHAPAVFTPRYVPGTNFH